MNLAQLEFVQRQFLTEKDSPEVNFGVKATSLRHLEKLKNKKN
jgi:hypothetical protein